ncbi:hypothetical protein Tco_1190565, partial [Tanacetum coccineum]
MTFSRGTHQIRLTITLQLLLQVPPSDNFRVGRRALDFHSVGTHQIRRTNTPAVTTSGTPSDTSGGRLDSTGAFSYQPRKRTRGSIFIQNNSGPSGISSSRRPRVCNDGRSRKPSGSPNYPTPAATTSGTPSNTATGHVDST